MGLVLSNKYLEVIKQFLKHKKLNEKAEVLFYKIKLNKTSTFSLNIFCSRECMMTSEYLFDRTKPIL